uniref:Uncharacterized protein n=1 Tax=Acrobeloides nanus TaxID=290746 RepID=A0A914EJZ8_9BILA
MDTKILIGIMGLHGPMDMFVIGYYIPAHRQYFIRLFNRIRRNEPNNIQSLNNAIVPVTQNNNPISHLSQSKTKILNLVKTSKLAKKENAVLFVKNPLPRRASQQVN